MLPGGLFVFGTRCRPGELDERGTEPAAQPFPFQRGGILVWEATSMAKRPRSFEEVVAALSPTERARIGRIDTFFDPNADRDEAEVSLAEDRDQPSEWRVEYFHKADGYVTIFAGPMAEERARDYFNALKSGRLGIIRENGQG
jgi:hypothetical protein